MSPNPEALRKKPYKVPSLRVHGDITELTRNSTGAAGMADNNPTAKLHR